MHLHPMTLTVALTLLALVTACSERPSAPAESAPADAPATTGVVESPDGVPIVYETRGNGETAVVFVHCWACNRGFWRDQVEPVAEAGYRAVTVDLPGHGESGANRTAWTVRGLAADVVAVADALGLDRYVLVGHSMGGPVSLAVAERDPDRVRGVACVDTLHDADFEWPEGMTEQLVSGLQADYRAGMESFVPQMFKPDVDPAVVEWVVDQAVTSDHGATIALMADFPSVNMPEWFSDAGVPIRCVNAAPSAGQGLATNVAANRRYADFDVVLMDGVGHYPQLERPREFNDKLLAVLSELAGAP